MPKIKEIGELDDLLFRLSEGEPIVEEGHKVSSPVHLFTKIDDNVIDEQVAKLMATDEQEAENQDDGVPLKEEITYDDFTKLDIRTATIIEAKKVEKADKLLQLTLDLGFEKRTVVSGIALQYKPEEVIGKKVSLLANLAPRKIRGVMSKGMILMAEDENGGLTFISPTNGWPDGTVIR